MQVIEAIEGQNPDLAVSIRNLMFVPMFEGSDGYGLTFGARIAYPKPPGAAVEAGSCLACVAVPASNIVLDG